MRKLSLTFVIAALLAVWSAPASAAVLYDNGSYQLPAGSGVAAFSDLSLKVPECAYDDFTLTSPVIITDMHWWGMYSNGDVNDSFYYDIKTSPGGSGPPGGTVADGWWGAVTRTPVATWGQGGATIYRYNVVGQSIPLKAGQYSISFFDMTYSNPEVDSYFEWLSSSSPGDEWESVFQPKTGNWNWVASDPGFELAFNLTGNVVPEPVSLIFFGTGLVGVFGYVARRRNR